MPSGATIVFWVEALAVAPGVSSPNFPMFA